MENEFVDIKGYEGLYKINRVGEILSLNYKGFGYSKILKNKPNAGGKYYAITLRKNGEEKTYMVHRLVAETFIPNPDNLPQINHKDENGLNNSVDNIEWCDRSYNMKYGTRAQRQSEKIKKPVIQYTLDGEFIKEWDGACDAEEFYNRREAQNICRCCRGCIKSAYGYKWKYKC